jgi:hypothetical protein
VLETQPNIQLAAIAVDDNWCETETFEKKIFFDESLADSKALEINHYDRAVWAKDAVTEAMALAHFDRFLCHHKCIEMVSKRTGNPYSVARLAGHNAVTFDMPRLRKMYGERFLPAHPLVLDTLQLALWWHVGKSQPENYQLSTLLHIFGIEIGGNAHDALTDVRGAASLARYLLNAARKD